MARVVIEVPRGSLVKRRADGTVRYLSPLPAPFNYGSVPDLPGGDGDPLDALVLGPRLPRGHEATWPVWTVVRFVDGGRPDDKLVCGSRPPTRRERWVIEAFFRGYGLLKRLTGRRSAWLGWGDRQVGEGDR